MNHRTIVSYVALAALTLGAGSCIGPMGTNVVLGGIDFVAFQDSDSDFATSDVLDIDGEVVRFDAANRQLIWVKDSLAFAGWDVDGNVLRGGDFTVRFGTKDGQRMAYFTETDPPTICDIIVQNGSLTILPTTETVPQE